MSGSCSSDGGCIAQKEVYRKRHHHSGAGVSRRPRAGLGRGHARGASSVRDSSPQFYPFGFWGEVLITTFYLANLLPPLPQIPLTNQAAGPDQSRQADAIEMPLREGFASWKKWEIALYLIPWIPCFCSYCLMEETNVRTSGKKDLKLYKKGDVVKTYSLSLQRTSPM